MPEWEGSQPTDLPFVALTIQKITKKANKPKKQTHKNRI